ncbi:MAG: hypothetical protein Q9166_000501 [cf. Caloplaca sp. 2 TL-2023]
MKRKIKAKIYRSVCTTSLLRMTTLSLSSKNPDTTYGTMLSTLWSNVEANTGIICACLPTLKKPLGAFYKHFFPARSSSENINSRSRTLSSLRGQWTGQGRRVGGEARRQQWEGLAGGGVYMRHDETMQGGGMALPMGEIHKRTDVRIQRFEDDGVGEGGRCYRGTEERVYPSVVHLV